MNFILVAFKNFEQAKSRMRQDLPKEKTIKIVEKMLLHVLTEVSKSKKSDFNYLITNDEKAISIAKKLKINIIKEKKQVDESSSIDMASEILIEKGAQSILRIPGDLPLIKYHDIDNIFKESAISNSNIIVPSKSGSGTNAILRCPPNIIKSFFGENSFEKHIKEFQDKNAIFKILKYKNIEVDLDSLDDLKGLQGSIKKEYFELIS